MEAVLFAAAGLFALALCWPAGYLATRLMIKAGIETRSPYSNVGTPESRRATFRRQVDTFDKVARPVSAVCALAGLVAMWIVLARS